MRPVAELDATGPAGGLSVEYPPTDGLVPAWRPLSLRWSRTPTMLIAGRAETELWRSRHGHASLGTAGIIARGKGRATVGPGLPEASRIRAFQPRGSDINPFRPAIAAAAATGGVLHIAVGVRNCVHDGFDIVGHAVLVEDFGDRDDVRQVGKVGVGPWRGFCRRGNGAAAEPEKRQNQRE